MANWVLWALTRLTQMKSGTAMTLTFCRPSEYGHTKTSLTAASGQATPLLNLSTNTAWKDLLVVESDCIKLSDRIHKKRGPGWQWVLLAEGQ
jgi:hypothetical protein